jgi:protein-arginine kinase activator protein McsA
MVKVEKDNQNEKKSKAHKYAQTLFKFHKFNPNLLRFKEISRMYNINPSEPLKAILEKDFDLHKYEMDSFTEEDLICMQSGYYEDIIEEKLLAANEKRKEPLPPISETLTGVNIDKFMLTGDFKKASIRSQDAVYQSMQVCEQQIKDKIEEQEFEESLAKLPKK